MESALLKIREKIEKISKTKFNSVLLNLYRSGADSVSWHSDDKPRNWVRILSLDP
ncbi:MAG: hypothetical protein CM1200mP30_05430 [Pseudomonadota bacterium]|nr:MAG: hypothetical protein CM1200mP30_05430 [Pseudomonadota bacterium]